MDQTLQGPTGGAPVDWRGLCEELLDCLDSTSECRWGEFKCERSRARAALAQPEPEATGPTDEEIMGLMPQQMHDDLAAAVRALAEQEGIDSTPAKGVMRIMLNRHVVDLARAVLARWGRPAPAPAGEVAELVRWLRSEAEIDDGFELTESAAYQRRAADLLERHAATVPVLPEDAHVIEPAKHTILVPAPVPVAVSERLPGPEDCDGEGFCWFWSPEDQCWFWERQDSTFCRNYGTEFHWLPATALPLPQGEVE